MQPPVGYSARPCDDTPENEKLQYEIYIRRAFACNLFEYDIYGQSENEVIRSLSKYPVWLEYHSSSARNGRNGLYPLYQPSPGRASARA